MHIEGSALMTGNIGQVDPDRELNCRGCEQVVDMVSDEFLASYLHVLWLYCMWGAGSLLSKIEPHGQYLM